jgi:sensor histidine kinase YesM
VHINSKYFTPATHVLIWVLLFTIPALAFHGAKLGMGLPANFFLITNIYHVGLFYLNAYFVYPKLMTRRRWPLYFPVIAALLAGSYFWKLYFLRLADVSFQPESFTARIIFFPAVGFIIASIIFRVIIDNLNAEKLQKQQKAERLGAELKFFRSQVSPHFLFNMMTNMVSLARQKSDLLEPSLMKLSDLLRYMLYEQEDEKCTVSKEITYLKSYIELQQLRFSNDVDVHLEIVDQNPNCEIEPMLLIPFVENAFKHGAGIASRPFIKISLIVKSGQLFLAVVNSHTKQHTSKDKSSGIGLDNVKNRLQLLYPGKYALCITDKDGIFTVELKIDLVC